MGTANIRKHFADDNVHTCVGRVALHDGDERHYFVNTERNLCVSVEIQQRGTPVWANMSNTPGVWTIPDIGDEVIIVSDNGEFEGELYLVGVISRTDKLNMLAPENLAPRTFNVVVTGDANIVVGPGASVRLISDTRVEAASANGSGVSLAIQEALHDIWRYVMNQFDPVTGHGHGVSGLATTNVVESSVIGIGATAPEPVGTDILFGE